MNTTYSLATVSTPSSNDRFAAAIAHGGTWVAWFIAPLLVYVLKRGESRYAEFHALQALLWSIAGTVVSAATSTRRGRSCTARSTSTPSSATSRAA